MPKDFIAEKGYDEQYGARPLKRAIQKYVEDPMAEQIINATLHEADTLEVTLNQEGNDVEVKVKPAAKKGGKKSKDISPDDAGLMEE